ncbi:host specificity protein J [Achromobacter mucicolens]|nr:phage tail protein [Achromobacter mucicolens]
MMQRLLSPAEAGGFSFDGPMRNIARQGGITIVGRKGGKDGGGARSPVEAPDSLHSISYAKVLDLISEGPIVGPVAGLNSILRSIYLDGTPIENDDGSLNFQGVRVDFRNGTQSQDYIQGFPAAESTTGLGVELKYGVPWVQTITDRTLSAVRITLEVRGLVQVDTGNGDRDGTRVDYAIDLQTDGGPFQEVLVSAFDGKTTQTYARTHRIDLPQGAQTGWVVRVRRLSINSATDSLTNATWIQSITNVLDAKLRMPMSAVVGIQVDASQFSAIPTRAYRFRGRIIAVPSNYDPETRTYTGLWDGTFKQGWTNNPAWIWYDMVTSQRYGAGAFLEPARLAMAKWQLYPIAQYCDEMIPDGFGGMEPRFTCNVYIQQAADAYRVMSDLASVFRGIVYEMNGAVAASADMPSEPVYNFTNANVLDGKFGYTGSPRRTRYTVVQVSWNDNTNQGIAKMEAVEDRDAITRYGVRMHQLTAFGCTSRGQAVRVAKWALLTSQRETQGVTFGVGLEQAVVKPGSVIRIADKNRTGRRIGGRIRSATATTVTVDLAIGVRAGDRLILNMPNGLTQTRIVQGAVGTMITADQTIWTADSTEITADMIGIQGATLEITVTQPFADIPEPEAVWTLESEELSTQLFRVISVVRDDVMTAIISAVQHVPGKYSAVDYGTRLENPPITVIPPMVMSAPENVALSSYSTLDQTIATHNALITWDKVQDAVEYQVQWRRNNSDWIEAGRTGSASVEIRGISTGRYLARVRAINAANIPSAWGLSASTELQGSVLPPPQVTHLTAQGMVFGIRLNWGFPAGNYIIERTELWYSESQSRDSAIKLGEFAFPQNTHDMMGLSAGKRLYFWARLVDRTGIPGDFFPIGSPGVIGTSSNSADEILAYLTNQITETQLAKALLDKINDGGDAQVQIDAIVNALAAMYTIKTQLTVGGVPYWAGIGVGVENNQGVITSQILLAAARVAVLDESTGSVKAPFVVQGGQVFMNEAIIGRATIGSANLKDNLTSDALNPNGLPVFNLNMRSGLMSFNGTQADGSRTEITNTGMRYYYPNGVLGARFGG